MKSVQKFMLASLLACSTFGFSQESPSENNLFHEVLISYFQLKNALVLSDVKNAEKNAKELSELTQNFSVNARNDKSFAHWSKIELASKRIAQAKSLEEQRMHFEVISNHMIVLLKQDGSKKQPVFLQYCSMAFDDKGAYWLSEKKEIRNPYFGSAMLKCGSVEGQF